MYKVDMMNTGDRYIKVLVEGKTTEEQLKLILADISQLPSELIKSLVVDTVVSTSTQEFGGPLRKPEYACADTQAQDEAEARAEAIRRLDFADYIHRYCVDMKQDESQVRTFLASLNINTIQEFMDLQDERVQI